MARRHGRRGVIPAAARTALALGLCASLAPGEGVAEAPAPLTRPTHNLFGMTGLIDTPSAEMQPDGQISLTTSYFAGFSRNTVSVQALPFLEAAFRYSALADFFPNETIGGALYDRSFDLKLRLSEDGPLWPSVAVGLQDFLGTGVYSGEYVVASKRLLDGDLTVTGGVGWGRFASLNGVNNPVGELFEGARTRDDSRTGGGDVNFGQFFSGQEMGFFGGLAWRTPLDGLTLMVEYANDDYAREREFSDFEQEIPINFGLEYRPVDWATIGAYALYGSTFGLRVTLSGNVFEPAVPEDTTPAPLPVLPRPVPEAARTEARAALGAVFDATGAGPATRAFAQLPLGEVMVEERIAGVRWARLTLHPSAEAECPVDIATAIDAEYGVIDAVTVETADGRALCTLALRPEGEAAIRLTRRAAVAHPTAWTEDPSLAQAARAAIAADLETMRLRLTALELGPHSARLVIENPTFAELPRAIGRAARAATRHLPASVEAIDVVPLESGMPVVSVAFARTALEDLSTHPDGAAAVWSTARVRDAPPLSGPARAQALESYPRLSWGIEPQVPISLFDPDEPVRADLQLGLSAGLALTPELSVSGTLSKRIVGNLDDIVRVSDSTLPRVRSDFAEYLSEGDPAITRLSADYVTKLAPDIYGRLSAGLLERMFGGVQAELLWKPAEQSWGLGAEVAYARQRDFDTLFTFQDYDVVTGHVSLYWDTPYRGLAMQLDAGRYLAGDYGGTVSLKRRFANGWEIGAFATFTDVSFDEFGEGSFDKGLFLTIPLNWTLPYETRSQISSVIRPLSRDGGQRLQIANRLYPVVEDADRGGLARRKGGFWE